MRRAVECRLRVFQPFVAACVACLCSSASIVIAEEPQRASGEWPPYVTPATVKQWQAEGPVTFLDVREADEFAAGHLPGAINVPSDQAVSLAGRLPHDEPIVVYCIHSAHRAPAAARRLREQQFTNAYVLEGGIVAWQAGGLTIRASDLAQAPAILPYTERCANKQATP